MYLCRMHLGWWRRKLEKKKHRSEHGGEASHQCHLGPVSSLSLERWFQHLKHQGEEGADGRRTAELRVVTKLLDGRTLKTRGQRALTGDSSRKASPLRLPKRGELQGDRQVSKPLAWGCCHGPAQENLGSRWWSWYGWMDTPGMLSSSLSLTVALSLRGSRPPPCEELGPFLTSKPAASLASPHDPACNLLTEGRESHTGTDGEDRSPECQQWEGDTHAAGGAGAQGLARPRGPMGRALPTGLAVSISQKPLMVLR